MRLGHPSKYLGALSTATAILFLSLFPIQESNAIFGLSKCEKVKSKITQYETELTKAIRSFNRLEEVVRKSNPSVTKAYNYQELIGENLYLINSLGLSNKSCFNTSQKARLQNKSLWETSNYVIIMQLDDLYNFATIDPYKSILK